MSKIPFLSLRTLALAGIIGTVAIFLAWKEGGLPTVKAYHSAEELAGYRGGGAGLPGGQNNYFMASGNCEGCHGHDPMGFSMYDQNGVDVNVTDDWRSTMMANSARDPFWRAKVSHEGLVNPGLQVALEDKCTSCHAPQGRHDKFLAGNGPYSIQELDIDPLGLDGVSCTGCHMQAEEGTGDFFSGNVQYDTNNVLFGQYSDNLFGSPMTSFVGYEPLYGAHVEKGEFCAGCHTLITETVDLQGVPTGGEFVEQATYHEWVNSIYNDNVSCQGCHVPRINDPVVISANYLFLQGRSPYGLHHFAGANSFMLKLLKDNILALGLTANETQFDSTIARTDRMLKNQSLLLDASIVQRDADTARIDVSLINLAGHKFPSGYPSRRAWVEVVVLDAQNDTIFKSGRWGSDYSIEGHDAEFEPHHDVIVSGDQVQIYEHVLGDVNGDKTTTLLRAATALKDNRIAPEGFSTSHSAYDTTMIVGVPASDIDFNHDPMGVEGSGSDIVHYRIPMNGYAGLINVSVRVWYQTAPPRWMQEMFAYNSAPIDTFRNMYDAADGTPVLVKEMSFSDTSTGLDDLKELGVRIFPNPVSDGLVRITGIDERVLEVSVHDMKGALVHRARPSGSRMVVPMNGKRGTYLVVIRTGERSFVSRVVVQ